MVDVRLVHGSALHIPLDDESVQCVVTSPPYWGLRQYAGDQIVPEWGCALGLEPTPELYVEHMVEIFREVRRVLRWDGTLWLNLGDSYAGSWGAQGRTGEMSGRSVVSARQIAEHPQFGGRTGSRGVGGDIKPKDLVGIPWAVSKALQAPYYIGRIKAERDRVWLAAMIDAEGTICGFDHDRKDGGGHRSGVHMTLTNTSTALLDEAARIWPTSRSEHERAGIGHLGKRASWRWIVHGIENKMAALRELYPYLIVKRQQAVVGYTLLTLMADAKRLARTPQATEVIAKRAVLTGLLSDLNQGRAPVLPNWLIEPPSLYEPGWYLRSDIIWHKPNPMPESVTDRPTKSHEYLFLLTKSERYYYDADAIREPMAEASADRYRYAFTGAPEGALIVPGDEKGQRTRPDGMRESTAGRNKRTVWTIPTRPYKGAHFATFPPDLVEPCVLAGSSPKACSVCGAPWERVTERTPAAVLSPGSDYGNGAGRNDGNRSMLVGAGTTTLGWRSTCDHDDDSGACVVLDPFNGSGTTGQVAVRLGRSYVGVDISKEYIDEQAVRRIYDVQMEAAL